MAVDLTKSAFLGREVPRFRDAHEMAVASVLGETTKKRHAVGVGLGVKWTDGQPTGDPAVVVFVTHKVPLDALSPNDRVPPSIEGSRLGIAVGTGAPAAAAWTASITRAEPLVCADPLEYARLAFSRAELPVFECRGAHT